MLRAVVVGVMAVSALALTPSSVCAQGQDAKLSELLPNLYRDVSIDEFDAFVSVFSEAGIDSDVYFPQIVEALGQRFLLSASIIRGAANQLSSFPIGSASGGFTWDLDAASATFTRSSNSFGPIFAERPLTIGRRRLNVGANYQRVTFDRLEGRTLRDGEITGYLGVNLAPGIGILFSDSLDLKVSTDTLNAFATYGLSDRLDIGIAVPVNHVNMRAALTTRIGNTLTGIVDTPLRVTPRSGSASGIGDVVVRAKYNILKRDAFGIAESIDVRLPTGDELDLLGIAGPQVKLTFISSATAGILSPHVNFAYTISGSSSAADDPDTFVIAPPEEVNYTAGADLALSLRTTVAVDAVGRVLRKAGTVTWGPSPQFGPQFPQFTFNEGKDLHLLLGSVGLKVNPFGNMLVTTNVLFPLTRSGLTDNLTWMAGVDYSF